MSERTCEGCGSPLPPNKALGRRRKWCSERCRKLTLYSRRCVDCGAVCNVDGRVAGAAERCLACARTEIGTLENRQRMSQAALGRCHWSEDDCVRAMKRAARRGYLTAVMYEQAYERAPAGSMPSLPTVMHKFDKWTDALVAAGLRGGTRHAHRERMTREGCLLAVMDCVAELGHEPTVTDYEAWARRVGAPSHSLVRMRCGGWMGALEDARSELQAVAA
jgi:hypothetical protein